MKPVLATLAGCLILVGSDAFGQSLADRIEHVQQQKTRAESRNTSKAHMLSTLLYTDISVDFQETPAREAINYLQTVLGISIVGRYSDDRTGTGIDPEAPVTLNAQGKPAITVLELVLDQVSDMEPTTWQLRDGFVEVGTKERLSSGSSQVIKYYPIRDLLFEPPKFDNAPKLDLDSALNQGNQGGGQGGGGGGGGFGGGGGGTGGGGGGGTGGGGGGSIFDDPGEDPEAIPEEERAQQIIDIIVETVEPEAWDIAGGSYATIRYYQGVLIIRAPDYIHRQIGGYAFAARPVGSVASAAVDRRYVTFTGGLSDVQVTDIRVSEQIGGSTGGSGGGTPSGTTTSGSGKGDGKSKSSGSRDSGRSGSSSSSGGSSSSTKP